ncbi:hypothetical protein KJ903_04515 [Patescibacteria group bacterium]|nr:hypothetical protein [Patescibacteria group bacterium]
MTINQFIKKHPHLVWSTKNYNQLSTQSIVEAVLNYGDWSEVQEMIKILGIDKTAELFKESLEDKMGRTNYRPEIANYFNLYFNRHV